MPDVKNSRYAVLRRFDLEKLPGWTKLPAEARDMLLAQLPDELWVPVDTVEAHDFREAILLAAGEVEGDYAAPPAARWEANRDQVLVDRRPVVSLRSRGEPVQPPLSSALA